MGRKRARGFEWLAGTSITVKKNRYIYREYKKCENGRPVYGKEINLGRIDQTSKAEVLTRLEQVNGVSTILNVAGLLDKYNKSEQYKKLAPRTAKDYERYYKIITEKEIKNGFFGDVVAEKVTPGAIRAYLDIRLKENAPIAGNKEIGYLSSAYSWAYQRDIIIIKNPCLNVTKNPKNIRQHYAPDDQYYSFLFMPGPDYIPLAMEFMYLCRLRKNEALSHTRACVTDKGLEIIRGKGSKPSLITWTPRLRSLVDQCYKLPLDVTPLKPDNLALIHDKKGQPITIGAFDSAWKRRRADFIANGGEPFTPHDLKRKAVSDFKGDKLKASGHRDPKMLAVYDVLPDEIDATK